MKKTKKFFGIGEVLFVIIFLWGVNLNACTGIYSKIGNKILIGNNEDGVNPETKIWFVPGQENQYGRMYVGYNDISAQGGVNEKGLWFDAFGLPYQEVVSQQGEIYPGDLQDKLMAECATVPEVLERLKKYNRAQLARFQWMFGDKNGNAVIIEGDAIIPIKEQYQIVTNFRQSIYPNNKGYDCQRFRIAESMLKTMPDVGVDEMRRILAATHSEGEDVTLYSYIVDLKKGLVYLYHFHNFENVIVFNIQEELAKGKHIYNLPELFPLTNAAQSFEYQAHSKLEAQKSARRDKNFDVKTYSDYCGRFVIDEPAILARQTISITTENSQLFFQLNDGGKLEVLPDSPTSFFLMNYGGMDFSCKFIRNSMNKITRLNMEGNGLSITATLTN
jgi:hypothetical protein